MPFATSDIFLSVQDFLTKMISEIAMGFSESEALNYGKLAAGSSNKIMGSTIWNYIGDLFGVVQPIGVALAVTVFVLNLIDLSTRENATFENFVKLILNIIFTIATINMAKEIINVFIGINDSLVQSIWDVPDPVSDLDASKWLSGIANAGLGIIETLVAIVLLIIPWLVGLIADVALNFPLISRCLEVAWRCVFFPIGVCNFTGGAQSPAIRYIKNLAATILVGVFFIVMVRIGGAAVTSIMDALVEEQISDPDIGSAIWGIIRTVLMAIVIKFAVLGVMMSGSRVMKEVIN